MPSTNPSGNATGPDEMQIGSSGSFKVDLYIPYPSVSLTFDAFAPLNHTGVMSVCSIAITGTGKNYDCLDKERNYTTYPATNSRGNERGRLVIGTVTNKGKTFVFVMESLVQFSSRSPCICSSRN